MKSVHKRDFSLGLIVFAIALLILLGILPWAVKTPKVIPNLALSPTFWPRIILVSIAGLGALLALHALRDGIRHSRPPKCEGDEIAGDGDAGPDHSKPFDLSDVRVLFVAGLMVVFCALLKPFGVVLPAVLLLLGMILVHERMQWATAIAVSIGTVLVLYLFFRHVARIPVPLGPLNGLF